MEDNLIIRPFKNCDAEKIVSWLKDGETYFMWGGYLIGNYPLTAERLTDVYLYENGLCEEEDNFYPWIAFTDEDGVIGHFIMRYIYGDNKVLRFGWVIVDDSIRGKGYGTSMLRTGLDYAFNILGVHTVTIGVFEHNDIAHNCYKNVGFVDKEIVPHERDNIIEMAITKEEYFLLKKL